MNCPRAVHGAREIWKLSIVSPTTYKTQTLVWEDVIYSCFNLETAAPQTMVVWVQCSLWPVEFKVFYVAT